VKNLIEWESNRRLDDDLHRHFEEFGRWEWAETAMEWHRVHNLMFQAPLELESPSMYLASAAVAQGHYGAVAGIAAALGVDASILAIAVAGWYENQDSPPAAIGFEGLRDKCEAIRRKRLQEATAVELATNQEGKSQ